MNKLVLHQKRSSSTFLYILVAAAAAMLVITTVSSIRSTEASDRNREAKLTFAVTHGPITMILADSNSNGHQLGDLRTGSLPTADEHGREGGRLDAMLVTTGIDVPNPGDEVRISKLIFVFGDGADQIVVNGSGFYPAAGGTIDLNTTLVRPITGGSGVYAGASGWADTEHLANGTWRHTFHLLSPR